MGDLAAALQIATRTPTICACGCGLPIPARSNARYATGACRTRDWKRREGYADPRRRKASRNAKSRPSGLQVSYRKAVRALARMMGDGPECLEVAERILAPALSDRQRTQLQAMRARARTVETAIMEAAWGWVVEEDGMHGNEPLWRPPPEEGGPDVFRGYAQPERVESEIVPFDETEDSRAQLQANSTEPQTVGERKRPR